MYKLFAFDSLDFNLYGIQDLLGEFDTIDDCESYLNNNIDDSEYDEANAIVEGKVAQEWIRSGRWERVD